MCGIGQREAQLLRQRRKAAAHVKNTHGLDPLNVSLRSLSDEEGLGALLSLEMIGYEVIWNAWRKPASAYVWSGPNEHWLSDGNKDLSGK
jgi:hypothetical protein